MDNEQMAKEIKTGNNDLIPELWESTKFFIFRSLNHIAERNSKNIDLMISAGITKEDLRQEAFFILLNAINAFDPAGGYTFLSSLKYASQTHFFALIGMRTAKGRNDPLSNSDRFERPLACDGEDVGCLGDTIPDETAEIEFENVIEAEYQRKQHTAIIKVLECLTSHEKRIINGRYFENKEFKTLSKEYSLTMNTVYQYHQSAIQKLRRKRELLEWCDDIIDRSYALCGLGFFRSTGFSSVEWAVEKIGRRSYPK